MSWEAETAPGSEQKGDTWRPGTTHTAPWSWETLATFFLQTWLVEASPNLLCEPQWGVGSLHLCGVVTDISWD